MSSSDLDVSPSDLINDPHFKSTFENEKSLGKGSFGQVHKARHRHDGKFYAIKCIRSDKVKEAEMMSNLDHKNVVRYYHSWIGDAGTILSTAESDSSRDDSDTGSDESVGFFDSPEDAAQLQRNSDRCHPVEQLPQGPLQETSQHQSGDDNVSENTSVATASESSYVSSKLLYIQMEYCDGETLRCAIDRGLGADVDKIWKLFRELAEGLAYIHGNKIVHRDLKPNNIFLQNGCIKIGDLGMATNFGTELVTNKARSSKKDLYGIFPYRAPELSWGRQPYDNKVDIYSLGIIFFEMMHKMKCLQEKTEMFKNIRKSTMCFPVGFNASSLQGKIVTSCLDHEPKMRKTAHTLLEMSRQTGIEPFMEGANDSSVGTKPLVVLPVAPMADISINEERTVNPEIPFKYDFHVGIFAHAEDKHISKRLRKKLQSRGISVSEYDQASNPGGTDLEKTARFMKTCLCKFWVDSETSRSDGFMDHYLNSAFADAMEFKTKYGVRPFFRFLSKENLHLPPPSGLECYEAVKENEKFRELCDHIRGIESKVII